LLTEQFAGVVEQYGFWKLKERGGDQTGVYYTDKNWYKNTTFLSSQTLFLKSFGDSISTVIRECLGVIDSRISRKEQNNFQRERVIRTVSKTRQVLGSKRCDEYFGNTLDLLPEPD